MTNSQKMETLCRLGRWDAVDQMDRRGQFVSDANIKGRLGHPEERGSQGLLTKIWTLGEGTERDNCGWSSSSRQDLIESIAKSGIYRAPTPKGTCVLLKTLYTNVCNSDCAYCINSTRTRETYSYTPDELARVFHQLYQKNLVQGLFLSSAMGRDPRITMGEMIDAVEILRTKYTYKGYIHLKILPGSSRHHVESAVNLANRVSLNVEEPSGSRLSELSTTKDYGIDILRRQSWVKGLSSQLSSGQATQFIVGATEETDWEIITQMRQLYEEMSMRRIHYSAFEPIPETKLQSRQATPAWREHRLYQVDWLYRVYHYPIKEIKEALIDDFLPNRDPKITIARLFLEGPVEINEASREELLRVPGIGPISAKRILTLRNGGIRINSRRQLAEIGVVLPKAQPFIKVNGNCQATLKDWL